MSPLFPTANERADSEHRVSTILSQFTAAIEDNPANYHIDVDQFRRQLTSYDFEHPQDFDRCIEFVVNATANGSVPMTHRSHFGLFNPAPAFPSEVADRISGTFNPQLAVWSHAPGPVEIERHTISAVNDRLGYPPEAGGHFTSGGSEANETAVLCALTDSLPDYATQGLHAFERPPRVYTSRESHLAWLKIAHRLGLGRDSVVLVETDGTGRMSPSHLRAAIEADKMNGTPPLLIVGTAGTTNAGMIDPLEELAEIAQSHKLWFHVDAAWGGALIASPTSASFLRGITSADSVTIDAHKWFATTMGTGMFLCRSPEILAEVFRVSADYMPSNDPLRDPYITSALWSRKFLGLRLFLSLAVVGWAGYADHIERARTLASRLGDLLIAEAWTVTNDSPVAVITAIPPPGHVPAADIVARIQDDGRAWISAAKFERTDVIRACITNGQSTEADIDALAALLVTAAQPA